MARTSHVLTTSATAILLAVVSGCDGPPEGAEAVVQASIATHGGSLFDESHIQFTFRDATFDVYTDRGQFRYQRSYRDALGNSVFEIMDNAGTRRVVNGEEVQLDGAGREQIEVAVNSVVYFAFLPYRLRDPSVHLRYLGPDEVDGQPYQRVEVTFQEEGGGPDWDARFVHWIHQDDHTLDYFGYRYSRDGGGTRFRRAVNRREVGGLLISDWENYGPPAPVETLEEYPDLLEAGSLNLLSVVELEDVRVVRAGDSFPVDQGTEPAAYGPGEGLAVELQVDRLTYSPGATVQVRVALSNVAEVSRTLEFMTSQRIDLVVLDSSGAALYRMSDDEAFLQVLGSLTLDVGDVADFTAEIAAPEIPGEYHLQAVITSLDGNLGTTLPFEVEP